MKKEIKLAILAIVTLVLAIWGYKFLSGKNLLSGDQTYYGIYDNVQDVNTATKVQINGVVVGSVISIVPQPEDVRKIKLGFTVNKDIRLPKTTIADLRTSSPLGGKMIELVFDKMCDGSNCAEEKTLLNSKTTGLIGSMLGPNDFSSQIADVGSMIDSTLSDIGDPNSTSAIDVSINEMSKSMQNLSSITGRMNQLMTRSAKDMEVTMANMAVITESLVQSQTKLNAILNNVTTVTSDLSQVRLSETMTKTNGTIDQAQASLRGVEATMEEATITMKELKAIVQKMENGDGTLGKLLNDETLYTNLNETTREMDLLLQDIRLNPRRYFRVFGKKSRDYELPEDDPATINNSQE